jgi:hypothetical protein
MDQDTTTQDPGSELLLGALSNRQADLLGQMLRTAYTTVNVLKDDIAYATPEWHSLDVLWDDLWELTRDANAAGRAAHEREIGAEAVAAARRHNHLHHITEAEQLLAAERTAPSAA